LVRDRAVDAGELLADAGLASRSCAMALAAQRADIEGV
jgi:hypothetical protein